MAYVLHTGDTHLGYHQYHKSERERDFMDAFRQTVQAAINADADAYVHAGDLFEHSTPSPKTHQEVLQELNRLDRHDIPFLGIVGNHDRATRGQWVDLLEETGTATHLGTSPTIIGNTAFYGLDYMGKGRRQQFEYQFEQSQNTEYSVLVAHGQFAPLTPGQWDLKEVLTRSNIDFDAVLLGDEHERQITSVDGTTVTYCGSTERTATDQRKPRSYNMVTFDNGVEIDQQPLDTRPFTYVTVELESGQGFETVASEIEATDVTDAVVRIVITGGGEQIAGSRVEEHAMDRGAFYAIVDDRREFDREIESIDVNFADPDDAVDERVPQMDFGVAIRDLEREVRDGEVAKSNLKQRAKDRVEEELEDNPDNLTRPTSEDTDEEPAEQIEEENETSESGESVATEETETEPGTSTSLTDFTD